MIASILGYGFDFVAPENIARTKIEAIAAYGSRIFFSPAKEGSDGARRMAAELAFRKPNDYYYLNQYANDLNWCSHLTTAHEIYVQTQGRISRVYVGLGTGGTAIGVGRGLKAKDSSIEVIGVMPDSLDHKLYGLKHITQSNEPPILDRNVIDRIIEVSDKDSITAAIRLAKLGLLVGPSSGAVYAAWLADQNRTKQGVTTLIMHDDARKYQSVMQRLSRRGICTI